METAEPAQNKADPDADLVAQIKKYVMENLEDDLAMPALSRAMGVSESYLRAVFRDGGRSFLWATSCDRSVSCGPLIS